MNTNRRTSRPIAVTVVSIVFIIGGLLSFVLPALLYSTGFHPTYLAYGFRVSFVVYATTLEVWGVYALVQGYGLWWMKSWSWWLYVVFMVVRLMLAFFRPQAVHPIGLSGLIVELLFLGYMIARRDRFNVKIPKLTTKRK